MGIAGSGMIRGAGGAAAVGAAAGGAAAGGAAAGGAAAGMDRSCATRWRTTVELRAVRRGVLVPLRVAMPIAADGGPAEAVADTAGATKCIAGAPTGSATREGCAKAFSI